MLSKHLSWALLFLLATLFLAQLTVVRADDVDDDVESVDDVEVADDDDIVYEDDDYYEIEDEDYQPGQPHPDVKTRVIFPDHPTKQFPIGKPIIALVSFSNEAPNKAFNITAVGAHLHSPFDLSYYIQNFSIREQDSVVAPGFQVSVEYAFMADPSLEALEFWFSAWVQYNDTAGHVYRNTFINSTVELVDAPAETGIKAYATTAAWVAAFTVAGFVGYSKFAKSGSSKSRKSRAAAVERGNASSSTSSAADASWVSAVYTPKEKAGRVSRSKNKAKKSESS